jgi:hypothetical protein
MRRPLHLVLLTLALLAGLMPATALGADVPIDQDGTSSDTMRFVDNIQYERRVNPATGQPFRATSEGTDMEFATIAVPDPNAPARGNGGKQGKAPQSPLVDREFAIAGSYVNGLQIIDVTDPEDATIVGVYDCHIAQGDVQVFQRDGRTYATYTADVISSSTNTDSRCYRDTFDTPPTGDARWGTFIIDITDPTDPQSVSFVPVPKGSHNNTIHPSGQWLYNSNSELIDNAAEAGIEIFSLADLRNPRFVGTLRLPPVPGLGTDSHDITFNADGTRAYSAALSQTVIINTERPGSPSIISTTVDPAINVEHQANPITINDPLLGLREFLIIEDEFVGALPTGQCPNGGVHVYDITGALELRPVKVGYWNIDEIRTATNDKTGGIIGEPGDLSRCTAHVFQLHEEEALMTIAFYNAGVRVVDLSGLVGVALGGSGVGMREVGFFQFPDSDTWAAKTNKINPDGSFFLYGNDLARGFDIYEYDPAGGFGGVPSASLTGGSWQSPAEALAVAQANPSTADYRPLCLLPTLE